MSQLFNKNSSAYKNVFFRFFGLFDKTSNGYINLHVEFLGCLIEP
jgi:hypothetical protein